MPSATPSDLLIRRAVETDASRLAQIHVSARRAAPMPDSVHPDDEVRAWLSSRLAVDEVWVAEQDGRVVGYARVTPGWLDDLYVDPEVSRGGVGSALLETVKALHPEGFALWVFESNGIARAFYADRGLVELEHTDGRANEERRPDVHLAWPGTDPLAYLRARIDEVDTDLADVLERRAALSRAIQAHKPVGGHQGRDPSREREIAERMAGHAPSLSLEALERVVDAVITAGLDSKPKDSGGSVGPG